MVDGAAKAAEFYKRAFGAEEVRRHPPDDKGRTMHIHLYVNGGSLMLSDSYPEHGHPWKEPQGFTLHLQVNDVDRWWDRAIKAGAEVRVRCSSCSGVIAMGSCAIRSGSFGA
jgi:PhnB protein